MAYDAEFIDGFDKYGPTGYVDCATLLAAEWTSVATGVGIVDALSGTGYALLCSIASTAESYNTRTLAGNYARIVGGATISADLGGQQRGITFRDAGTAQVSINFNASGQIEVRRGSITGTVIATSTEVVASNSTHCIEWDITIHNTAGIVKIWLDGVPTSISLTGQNTRSSANNYANEFGVGLKGINGQTHYITIDHLYLWLFLASGGSETPALTNPTIETQVGTSDSAVAWTKVAGVLGEAYRTTTNTSAPAANSLVLRKFTPPANCTINSVAFIPGATSATAKFKAVIYADSSGAPGSLLSSGTEVVGCTNGSTLTGNLTTPQALTGGTQYWIGYVTDTSIAIQLADTNAIGYRAANTYTSGAPGTAPAMTAGQGTWLLWGNCTSLGANWPQVGRNPPLGDRSYNSSSTVGQEDLFNFPALSSTPSVVYTVAVSAYVARSDAGARTIDLRSKSGSTTGSGSAPGISPALSYSYARSYFDTNPDTGAAWTASGLASSKHGIKIAS